MEWTPEQLKAIRLSKGMTQAQFAEYLEVTERTVINWEHAATKPRTGFCQQKLIAISG